MTKTLVISSPAPLEAIKVDLVGKPITIFPLKSFALMKVTKAFKDAKKDQEIIINALLDWLKKSTSPKDYKDTVARLEDPKDPLDIVPLTELFQQVVESTAGNPTT